MTNGKPLGGTLRVCLRTIPVSLDLDRYVGVPLPAVGDDEPSPPKSPSIVRYKNGLTFAFKSDEADGEKKDGDGEKTSIAAIKKEINSTDTSTAGAKTDSRQEKEEAHC